MYKTKKVYTPVLATIDFLGSCLFFWKKYVKFNPKKVKRILVIKLDHIGDVLLSTPVFRALKERFSSANIDVLVRPFTAAIIENNPYIHKVLALNPPWFKREKTSLLNLLRFITNNLFRYDLVVELHADPRNIFLANLVGRYSIGYKIRGFGFLFNKVAPYNGKKHIIQQNLDIVRSIDADASQKMDIFLNDSDMDSTRKLFDKYKIKRAFCIAPGTGRINKFWFNDRWAGLADKLIEKYQAKIIFIGSTDDKERIKEIVNSMKSDNYVNLVGKTSLKESATVIKQCDLFISPDTGPMHFAKAVDTPLVALFGPVDPKIWGYNDKKSISLHKKLLCSFCDLPRCHNNRKYECMKSIKVKDILSAVRLLLE